MGYYGKVDEKTGVWIFKKRIKKRKSTDGTLSQADRDEIYDGVYEFLSGFLQDALFVFFVLFKTFKVLL
jgi:hypothetical protein